MPSETRVIKFTNDELMTALFRYSRRNDEREKPGLPRKVELSREGEVSATLHVSHQDPVKYHAAYIAAALILFCGKRKVPLPKKATKSLHVQGKHAVLVLKSGDNPPLQVPS